MNIYKNKTYQNYITIIRKYQDTIPNELTETTITKHCIYITKHK